MTGLRSYLSGNAAEDSVVALYERNGFEIVHRRYLTSEGEIDIIARHGAKHYFIEVKFSSSFERAAAALSDNQKQRIRTCASSFLTDSFGTADCDSRFDAALVDSSGRIKILPGAF